MRRAARAAELKMQIQSSSRSPLSMMRSYYLLCQIILLVILFGFDIKCQQLTPSTTATTTTTTATTTTTKPRANSSEASELILSADEFVDSREVPLILIDGTANEETVPKSPSENATTTRTPASSSTDSSHRSESDQDVTIAAPNTTTDLPTTSGGGSDDSAADDGAEDEDEADDARSTASLSGGAPFEPPQNISQYMDYIEKLFHDLRHQISHLFEPHLPQLIRTSQMVELTNACSYDMLRMALALRQFEPWALRMIDSSGKVPEGIFEGSFTALGSYDECLSTVFQSASSHSSAGTESRDQSLNGDPDPNSPSLLAEQTTPSSTGGGDEGNKQHAASRPTQGKYCLVTVSPFMPPKPPADKVDRLFQEEANRRNYTRDDQFSRLSPMFYYMKFRIGVCIPSTCDQSDMNSISSALSSSLRLNITIPDCRVKQTDQQLTRHQLVGGLIFGLVVVLVLGATLIDCFKLKWKQLEHQDIELLQEVNKDGHVHHRPHLLLDKGNSLVMEASDGENDVIKRSAVDLSKRDVIRIKIDSEETEKRPDQSCCPQTGRELLEDLCSDSLGNVIKTKSIEGLAKHWTWMSFSLITNFRLYFHTTAASVACRSRSSLSSKESALPSTTIACLNGIRVLSLCWVIVANSYLTLDPRATKRLTKTREAPRDFLFQLVVQASLAIETFFFLSGLLLSISFSRRLLPTTSESSAKSHHSLQTQRRCMNGQQSSALKKSQHLLKWLQFYVHRYIRMTPPTMLVIAFSMYAYHYGDGPLWFEATQRVHQSCTQNWWRHLLHVANFIDTRQMCFIHYWYIAADMQLFLVAPLIMFLLFKYNKFAYCLMAVLGSFSIGSVFYTTYTRSLPPTLLFYSTDPESRREFGNTIMTKPMTHALPYMVGMLVGWWCVTYTRNGDMQAEDGSADGNNSASRINKRDVSTSSVKSSIEPVNGNKVAAGRIASYAVEPVKPNGSSLDSSGIFSATGILGSLALCVALIELFLPYKWNNSHLPSRFMSALYAALFRLGWSLVLAYVVISCRHKMGKSCESKVSKRSSSACACSVQMAKAQASDHQTNHISCKPTTTSLPLPLPLTHEHTTGDEQLKTGPPYCHCGSGGNYLNRLLGLSVFSHLSKLSFVAYLIHLPLMSVFIGQTRGLFAFSHTLVIHFAISYLVISFALSFLLVHFIEFPFITFERLLFERLFHYVSSSSAKGQSKRGPTSGTNDVGPIDSRERQIFYGDPRIRPLFRRDTLEQQSPPERNHAAGAGQQTDHQTPTGHFHRTVSGYDDDRYNEQQKDYISTERL